MGALRDAAKNNSNFLLLEKGSFVIAEYVGFQLIPNMRDPSKQSALYEFREMGKQKFWTNGSSAIMFFFDDCPKGRLVKITRNAFFNKQGAEDPLKSSYEVELYYEPGTQALAHGAQQETLVSQQSPTVGAPPLSNIKDMQNFNTTPTQKETAW